MKENATKLLAILLILGCIFAMTACGEKEKEDKKGKDDSLATVVSAESIDDMGKDEYILADGYTLYQKDAISFAYPEDWSLTDGSTPSMTGPSGNNINLLPEPATEENTEQYKSLSRQNFMELIGNALESFGMTVSNVKVETKTNDGGVEIIACTYDATYMGQQMSFYQYIILGEKTHYTVTATEFAPMADVIEELFGSIRVK